MRRQDNNETILDFEQGLCTLHWEARLSATNEQWDAAVNWRFKDGLASTEMVQFLRLHARDHDFRSTVMKARQFADVSVQSRPKKKVCLTDLQGNYDPPVNAVQADWEPIVQGFREMMTSMLQLPVEW